MSPEEATTATPASDWKRQFAPRPLQVPSGNTALVRKSTLDVFWKRGQIPNVLTPFIMAGIEGKQSPGLTPDDWTPEQLRSMVELIDRVVVVCCIDPKVHAIPVCTTCHGSGAVEQQECRTCGGSGELERDPNKLYTDEVDLQDRMAVFSYAIGGVNELESFRPGQGRDVDGISDGEAMERQAELTSGAE